MDKKSKIRRGKRVTKSGANRYSAGRTQKQKQALKKAQKASSRKRKTKR